MGIVLQLLRAGEHRFIALHHLAGHRGVHVLHSLHRFNRSKRGALVEAVAHVGEIYEHDVPQLIHGKGTDAHPHKLTVGIGVLVAVSEAEGSGELERHRRQIQMSSPSLREIDQPRCIQH